jgi:hypothetical protein
MATVAHRFERRIDLAKRALGHADVSPPFSDNRQRHALRNFATISSGLYRFLAITVLLDVKDIPQVGPLQ